MIVVEAGSAYALSSENLVSFRAALAQGIEVSAAAFGCEVCPVLGELNALLAAGKKPMLIDADMHDQFLVQIEDTAVLLSEEEWLAFLIDVTISQETDLRDYGTVFGDVMANQTGSSMVLKAA